MATHLGRLITSFLGDDGYRRFLKAMTLPGADRVVKAYYTWGLNRQQHYWKGDRPLWELGEDGPPRPVIGKDDRSSLRDRIARDLEKIVRAEVKEYGEFEAWIKAEFIDRHRARVAKMRILEPFLAAADSAFVEMTWHELPEEERKGFVRSGIKWERWLLKRRGRHQMRAEQAVAGRGARSDPRSSLNTAVTS